MIVITIKDLIIALRKTLGKKGIKEDELRKLAEYLMNFFGYDDEIIDNRLSSKDRDVFYMLEEEGLLTTKREEVLLKKGKMWRIHYWVLRKDRILNLAKKVEKVEEKKKIEYTVYEEIPPDVWSRGKENESKKESS